MNIISIWVSLVIISIVDGQINSCPANQSFKVCGTSCEPSCALRNPICSLRCVIGCQCNSGYVRNAARQCVPPNQCPMTTTTTTTPRPPTCTGNQVYTVCFNPCTERRCSPIPCPLGPCRPGCTCQPGYMRNNQGVCVLPDQCFVTTTTTPRPITCPANQVNVPCYNPCTERKCPTRFPPIIICIPIPCRPGCGCRPGYVRNTQGQCVRRSQCPPSITTTTTTTQGPPTCPANEVYIPCYIPCTERRCPTIPIIPCILMICHPGCTCSSGYVRNAQGVCVLPTQCPLTVCNLFCIRGLVCRVLPTGPTCVRIGSRKVSVLQRTHQPTCKRTKCRRHEKCALARSTSCQSTQCETPICVAKNPCKYSKCGKWRKCILRQVVCIRAPCYPVAECVPKDRSRG